MIDEEGIPENWDVREMSELGDFRNGKFLPKKDMKESGDYLVYGGNGVMGHYDDYWVEQECIVIGRVGMKCGTPHIADEKIWATDNSIVYWSNDTVKREYLYRFLQSYNFDRIRKQSAQSLIAQRDVKDIEVPVPPLDEQERIVEAVEERLKRVERLEKSVENVGRLVGEYQNSLVASLLTSNNSHTEEVEGGIPTENDIPDGWKISTISNEAKVILGNSPPGESYNENNNGVPFIQGASAFREQTPETERFTSEPTKVCEEGDSIIAIRATIGDLNEADKSYCLGRGVAGVRAGDDVLQDYLYMYLEAIDELDYWKEVSTGSTFHSITKTNISDLNIPVPPLDIQQTIVNRKNNIDFNNVKKSVGDVNHLFKEYRESILSYAFCGNI